MTALLTILACFAGVFAFAFGMAGFVGLVSFEPPKDKRGAVGTLIDHLVTGGFISILRDIERNWPEREAERRLLYLGFACGLACIVLVMLVKQMS